MPLWEVDERVLIDCELIEALLGFRRRRGEVFQRM